MDTRARPPFLTRRDVLLVSLGALVATTGCGRRSRSESAISAPQPTVVPSHMPPAGPVMRQPAALPAVAQVPVVPRTAWTANAVGTNCEPMGGITAITLHHTGEHLSSSGIPDLELIRRIENHHRKNLGWAAIGYHYLIGKNGTIYEGRPAQFQGAHCGGDNNRRNLGITMIGEFDHVLPSAAQLHALTAFLRETRIRLNIAGKSVFGHRDFKNTICPGNTFYAWIQRYRQTPL